MIWLNNWEWDVVIRLVTENQTTKPKKQKRGGDNEKKITCSSKIFIYIVT